MSDNTERNTSEKKCKICNLFFPKEIFNDNLNSTEHEKKKEERKNTVIECEICKEKYLRKNSIEHKKSEKRLDTEKQIKIEIVCGICGEKYLQGQKKEHNKTKHKKYSETKQGNGNQNEKKCEVCDLSFSEETFKEHKKSAEHKRKIAEKEIKTKCKLCNEIVLLKNVKEHNRSEKHLDAQQRKKDKIICKTCGNVYIQGFEKEHNKTHHKVKQVDSEKSPEIYKIRSDVAFPEANQLYLNTLAVFYALRYSLEYRNKDFKISVNDEKWDKFGDIVIETDQQIEAFQCKQTQTRNSITTQALSAESGKFSIKEQCQVLEKLRKKKEYEKAAFKLFTASFFSSESIKFNWDQSKVTIEQSKRKSIFNTSGDPDDVFFVKVENCDEVVEKDLDKFRILINQKKINSLEFKIRKMIADEFGPVCDVCDGLVKFVKDFFQTIRKTKHSFKLTKKDFLIKLCQLLLEPFHFIPDVTIEEKCLDLWVETIKGFDIVIVKDSLDIVKKVYSTVNCAVKKLIQTDLKLGQTIKIKKNIIEDHNLKSPSRELTLTFWKLGLIPIVFKAETFDHLDQILKIASFLKTADISRQFIISTGLKPQFPLNLKVFQNLSHVQNSAPILILKIKILGFEVTLQDMYNDNEDILHKLTPDDFLNILWQDFCFKNIQVPLTSDIIDNTWVLSDDKMNKIETSNENQKNLKYLVNDEDGVRYIVVPPEF